MLTVSRVDSRVVVGVNSAIDGTILLRLLRDLIDGQGNCALSVHVHDPEGIDSVGVAALLHTAREVVARGGCLEVDGLSDEAQVAIRLMCARPGVPITTVASCDDAIRDLFTLSPALHALDTTYETAEIVTSAIEVLDESIRQVRLHAHHLASRVEGRGDHKEIR